MQEFKPQASPRIIWGWALILLIVVSAAAPAYLTYKQGEWTLATAVPFVGLILLALGLVGYFLYAAYTLAYEVDEKQLVIRWANRRLTIPLKEIKKVELSQEGKTFARLWGASWPGLHIGTFAHRGEKYNLHATARKNVVLLYTKKGQFGLTPANREEFLAVLQPKAGKSGKGGKK
ncbi:PH domain-containing protein [Carboxydocella sp. JDF658]|uniref:PH domain-containing protein n=1 Tax=Carboxydocella sp. JDF658 TaxID=1926600 RepID=UPI0009ADFF06|nr:PH domain-containing protein [Carboxydocella sp. JDF658]GAW31097.1 hypothetical protein JDF658_08620 [Carboxydocella sp. JDF658]